MDTEISDYERAELKTIRRQDEAFMLAMMRAVHRGQEHPPMIGVDTRPGTHNAQQRSAA